MQPIDPDKKHAIEVRFYGRLSWIVLAAGVLISLSADIPAGVARMLFLGAVVASCVGLNMPAVGVVQRAVRERVARKFVWALMVPLVLRGVALVAIVGFLAAR